MRRFRLTYANVVSTMAFVLALGGGAYAAASQSAPQSRASVTAAGTTVLGHGQTERGVYDVGGMEATGATQHLQLSAATFPSPLNFVPVAHVLGTGQHTKACPGTVRKPSAKAGHLCIYQGGQWSNDSVILIDPRTQGAAGLTRWGFVLSTTPYTTSGSFSFDSHGTWAVTAP
jgi:hypothetical protein